MVEKKHREGPDQGKVLRATEQVMFKHALYTLQ